MDNVIPFEADKRLQKRAIAKGLFISVDRFGYFYLGLTPEEIERRRSADKEAGMMNIDPYLVLAYATLDQIRDYLDLHTGPHRFLTPAEVLGPIIDMPQADEDG